MDIDYLLMLQNFRTATGGALDNLMCGLSSFVVGPVITILFCIVYWVFDKKFGTFVFFNYAGGRFVNGLIKLTACVYRPWIRDTRVLPVKGAISGATSYSFPSGHSTIATAYYGSAAFNEWKKRRVISVLFIILIGLTLFSRNYLGVHTPQDVIIGFAATSLVMAVNFYILKKIEEEPSRDLILLIAGIAISIAALIYFLVKSYPMDYTDGKLLVDPEYMKLDAFDNVGVFLGFVIGWFVEHRFIRFEDGSTGKKRINRLIISAVAAVPLYFIIKYGYKMLGTVMIMSAAELLGGMSTLLYIMILVPFVIKITENHSTYKEKES